MSKKTVYAQKIAEISRQIFGELSPDIPSRSKKHVYEKFKKLPYYKDERLTSNYYPRHDLDTKLLIELRKMGMYHDARYDFKQLMMKMRLLRGKKPWVPKFIRDKMGKS